MIIPTIGSRLRVEDLQMIMDNYEFRKINFPDEPISTSLGVILFNLGDQYSRVYCVAGEWAGYKYDLRNQNLGELPKCPNGHVLTQDEGLKLGWVS